MDLNVSTMSLLSELRIIICQRLIGTLCPECSQEHHLTAEEREMCIRDSDPTYRVVDKAAQNALRYRYDKYRQLLTAINECCRQREMEIKAKVVATKVENPGISQQEIAERCYLNAGTVSRCLRNFTQDMYPYLE